MALRSFFPLYATTVLSSSLLVYPVALVDIIIIKISHIISMELELQSDMERSWLIVELWMYMSISCVYGPEVQGHPLLYLNLGS